MGRIVCWFSCGATSAVATRLRLINALGECPSRETHVVYIDTGSEHPDNARFLRDVEAWIKHPIEIIKSADYADTWDVFRRTRWLVGPAGARCTTELKKKPRMAYQQLGDEQVFGFDAGEAKRAARFRRENPDIFLTTPLLERGLTKPDCLAMLTNAGIELPAMYRLGFTNANCVGCVKGQMGYWNKIRKVFPETFARMAAMEREIGAAICHTETGDRKRVKVYLDELDPEAGNPGEVLGECSITCYTAEQEIEAARRTS